MEATPNDVLFTKNRAYRRVALRNPGHKSLLVIVVCQPGDNPVHGAPRSLNAGVATGTVAACRLVARSHAAVSS
jgi:hypothetical protein